MEREQMKRRRPNGDGELIAELEEHLEINSLDLEREVTSQPALFYKAAQMLASVTTERDRVKNRLEDSEAVAGNDIRGSVPPDKRITIAEVDAMVRLDPAIRSQREHLIELNGQIGRLTALKDGYSQRGWSLHDAVVLQQKTQSVVDVEAHRANVNDKRKAYYTANKGWKDR